MEVHIKKYDCEKYECGLCDFEARNLENLEMHLTTCEMYKCGVCGKRCNNLEDMKKHISEEDRDSGYVSHYKVDRHKASEMSERIFRISVS